MVRAGRIHKVCAFEDLAIFIDSLSILGFFFQVGIFFHQNWEKCILFGIGNGAFYGTRVNRQKNPY